MPETVLQLLEQARAATKQPKSEEQAEAGNYPKGKVNMHGLRISLENPKGTTRSGTADNGKKWSTLMVADYGYIAGTLGKDGDHVDVFIGPNPESELVFVVNQNNPGTKTFDEHKCMIGYDTEDAAKKGYLANYEDGWQGLGSIVPMHMTLFKTWLDKHSQNKPAKAPVIKKAADDQPPTVAIDLDGTLAKHYEKYDKDSIPDPRPNAKKTVAEFQRLGYRIIIFTVRGDVELVKNWLNKHDIHFDYINENPDQPAGSSDKVIADVYIDDRAVDGTRSWTQIEKTVGKLVKKAAVDPKQLMQLTRHPLFQQWLAGHGYIMKPQSGSMYDQTLDLMRGQDRTKAMQLADEADIPARAQAMRGFASLMGQPHDGRGEQYERMARDLSVVAPLMSHVAPDLWSSLHGGTSAAPLAGAIQQAGQDRIRPEMAAAAAKNIANHLHDNPDMAQGFSTVDLGEIYGELARRGLASDITTEGVQQSLTEYVPAMRAARDTYGRSMTASELFTSMGSQLHELPPDELAQKIYEQSHYDRLGGKSEATMRNTGITPGFGQKSVAELGHMDQSLLSGAAESPLAQQLGATLAMDEAGLLAPGSPAQQYAQQIRAGQSTDLAQAPGQWMQMMEQSGVGADVASTAMRSGNQEQIQKYQLGDMVRGMQRDVDVQPFLAGSIGDDNARAVMNMPQEAHKDRNSQMAALQKASPGMSAQQAYQTISLANNAFKQDPRFGRGLRTTMQLHNPQAQKQRTTLHQQAKAQATQRMDWGKRFARQSMDPIARLGATAREAGKPGGNMSFGQAAGRVLNLTPKSEIPKLVGGPGS